MNKILTQENVELALETIYEVYTILPEKEGHITKLDNNTKEDMPFRYSINREIVLRGTHNLFSPLIKLELATKIDLNPNKLGFNPDIALRIKKDLSNIEQAKYKPSFLDLKNTLQDLRDCNNTALYSTVKLEYLHTASREMLEYAMKFQNSSAKPPYEEIISKINHLHTKFPIGELLPNQELYTGPINEGLIAVDLIATSVNQSSLKSVWKEYLEQKEKK